MASRHKSRQRALQILFQVDQREQPVQDAIAAYYESLYSAESETELSPDPFMEELVGGAVAKREEIDRRIAQRSEHWRLERMPVVDRNILRLAIYEMTELHTPPAVVIDEAIELARRFSGEASLPFINGVLDAVRRESFPNDSSTEPHQDLR